MVGSVSAAPFLVLAYEKSRPCMQEPAFLPRQPFSGLERLC
jgi:hypothetical protein